MTHGVHAVQHEVEHEIKHGEHHGGHTNLLDNINKKVALLIGVLAAIIVVAFAKVARMGAAAAPIPYMQLASTMSAAQKSNQKTLASANRHHQFVPLPVHRIAPYHSLILFVGCPVNIT